MLIYSIIKCLINLQAATQRMSGLNIIINVTSLLLSHDISVFFYPTIDFLRACTCVVANVLFHNHLSTSWKVTSPPL